MRKFASFLCLLLFSAVASAQQIWNYSSVPPTQNQYIWANAYGNCRWDATDDVGPCVNAAIAAGTPLGATILFPCGTFGLATQIVVSSSGIHLQGCGVGNPRDSLSSTAALGVTKLKWIGTATSAATPMILVDTPNNTTPTLYSVDLTGIIADCNSLAGSGIELAGVSFSVFKMGASECTGVADIWVTVPSYLAETGNQHNDFWLYARTVASGNLSTGVFVDGSVAANFNTSYNRFYEIYTWYNNGDGIVFGNDDNNQIWDVRTFASSYGTSTGFPFICSNDSYQAPNGVVANTNCRYLTVQHYGGKGFWIQGYQAGAVFTPGGSNTGSGALAPVTIATTASALQGAFALNFLSTANVNANYSVACATGYACGVMPGSPIVQINNTANTITFSNSFDFGVANNQSLTFTFGFTSQAAAGPGTYTITATASNTFSIAYSGTGTGHAQSGIVPTAVGTGFALIFTDVVIPFSGTANTGDTFTINLPTPAKAVAAYNIDKGNNTSTPDFEYGSSGLYWPMGQALPWAWNEPCNYVSTGQSAQGQTAGIQNSGNAGLAACTFGGVNNTANGNFSTVIGGNGNTSNGFAAITMGQSNTASGVDSTAMGKANNISGTYGVAEGNQVSDNGLFQMHCMGGGDIANLGDSETCITTLHVTGAGAATGYRLTGDGNAAGASNCLNIPASQTWGFIMNVTANDRQTPTKNAAWTLITGSLTRPASGPVGVQVSSVASPNYSNGTITGSGLSITADTTLQCLNVTFTTPTVNTDNWDEHATVILTRSW